MTNQNNKISVIVPIFNSENYLDKCIESILAQTHKDFELLCINDGSTDKSLALCEQWQQKDNRIKIFDKKNGGLSSARNFGIEKSTCALICFIDSDDYIEPNYLEVLLHNLTTTNSDISVCSFFMENEDGSQHCECEPLSNGSYSNTEALELLSATRQDRYVVAWNKLYKKELFKNTKFPIGKVHEDQAIMHYLFFDSNKISTCENKLYHYVVHNNSISHGHNIIKHFDDIDALFDRVNFYKQKQLHSLLPGVENTLLHLFEYYKKKACKVGNLSEQETSLFNSYGKKCLAFFEECFAMKDYSKKEIRARKKTYRLTSFDKFKSKLTKLLKNSFAYRIYKKFKNK